MLIRVLHIDTGKTFRGGQNLLLTLLAHLSEQEVESHVVIPRGVAHREKFIDAKQAIEKNLTLVGQFKTAYELARYCRLNNIDLLHTHTSKAHTLALLINLLAARKMPLIVHRHVIFQPPRFFLHTYKYSSRVVAHFIAISEAVKKVLLDFGIAEHHITITKASYQGPLRNPEDKRAYKQALIQQLNLDPNKLLVGYCGALTAEKGCLDFLKAIDLYRKASGETPQVVIAGDGALKEKMGEEIKRLKLSDKVVLLGFIDKIEDFFAALDILVFPSVSEGLGLSLLEAAYGLCAVIATRVGGISEVIVDEKTGLLVPPQTPRDIANALGKLLPNPLLRLKYALNLRAHVKKHFSPAKLGEECSALYRKILLQQHEGPRPLPRNFGKN